MTAKALMIQGTGSSVGKSLIAAGLCRIFSDLGVDVVPFKSQNMALNSFVTKEGLEIARAQAVQARAARVEPSVDFNPILLKPIGDSSSQVIVTGKAIGNHSARAYHIELKEMAKEAADKSLKRLQREHELILIEGAGSPAEVNLKSLDMVNMAVAKAAKAPVLLVGDIDKGGVLASLVGTLELLDGDERKLIRGLIINKFRGDLSLLEPAIEFLKERTKKPVLGVVPFIGRTGIEEEDGIAAPLGDDEGFEIRVAVLRLPKISNFTDFDPLALEDGVRLRYVDRPEEIDGSDLLIIPGSKNTISDLKWLYSKGFKEAIHLFHRSKKPIIGICGGLQMLGKSIADPEGFDGTQGKADGLSLLDIETELAEDKVVKRALAEIILESGPLSNLKGHKLEGYEIHHGRTIACGSKAAFEIIGANGRQNDGFIDDEGLVFGTYLHGIFEDDKLRSFLLLWISKMKGIKRRALPKNFKDSSEASLNAWAAVLKESLDIDKIIEITGLNLKDRS